MSSFQPRNGLRCVLQGVAASDGRVCFQGAGSTDNHDLTSGHCKLRVQSADTSAFGVRVRCDDDTVTVADKAVSGRGAMTESGVWVV